MLRQFNLMNILRRWKLIIALAILGGLVGFGLASLATPLYQSTASLFVTLSLSNSATDLAQGTTYTSRQMSSFGELARSQVVLEPVIKELGLDTTPTALSRAVAVSTPRDTVIIQISASSASPQRAADIANAVANQTAKAIEDYAPRTEGDKPSIKAKPISTAVPALFQSSPNKKLNALAGVAAGGLAGILGVFLVGVLDRRIRDTEAMVELVQAPHLGTLRRRPNSDGQEAVVWQDSTGVAAEEYRQLRSALRYATMRRRPLVIAVSSSVPGEGKTTVSTNLAAAIAETDQKVLLIDADLRKPRVAQYTQTAGSVGLADVLVGAVALEDALQSTGPDNKVDILAGGSLPPNPGELVASTHMADLVAEVRSSYDVVILDTAPVLAVADAFSLAQLADGLLLVVRAGITKKADLTRSLSSVEAAGVNVFGLVLNGAKIARSRSYSYVPTLRESAVREAPATPSRSAES
ncbi:MAG: polysaccharide biosynthesis tyrosine autokinase [Arachnia sp.]